MISLLAVAGIWIGLAVLFRIAVAQGKKKAPPAHDNCETCNGVRGGVPGNENVFQPPWGGRKLTVCDYCHADLLKGRIPGGWPPIPNPLPPPPPPPGRNPTERV